MDATGHPVRRPEKGAQMGYGLSFEAFGTVQAAMQVTFLKWRTYRAPPLFPGVSGHRSSIDGFPGSGPESVLLSASFRRGRTMKYLTTLEVARELKVSKQTLLNWL